MFLTYDRVFPTGATEADLLRIVRPRPGLPFTPVSTGDRQRLAWTTFTRHQIDLDVHHAATRRYLSAVLRQLADAGVAMVRLDAVGYAVKTAGTSCFLTPETYAFIDALTAEARQLGLEVLAEVHAPHRYAVDTARHVDRIYDFVLCPLVLHAVLTGDAAPLRDWLIRRPANTVTVLDTHDGLGMLDAGGPDWAARLLTPAQIAALVETISRNSGGTSTATTVPGGAAGTYQISCTLYDALGQDDRRQLLARLIQLFTPGIPQIYYVGLLAGSTHPDLATRTGDPRESHRHRYSESEVTDALQRPVVRATTETIRLRATHPAFRGRFALLDATEGELAMAWRTDDAHAELRADLGDGSYRLTLSPPSDRHETV